jgi:predicted regulator of Ras-like GTPase activity (Roadblock/LC7/MglB family)
MASKKEMLEQVLSDLSDSLGSDLLGALIATPDGQVVVSLLMKGDLNAQKLAAMAAAVVGTSDRLSKLVEAGDFQDVLVRCERENIMARRTGRRAILVTVVKKDANIGLLNIEIEDAASRIISVLGS